jgi:hypothetical protein
MTSRTVRKPIASKTGGSVCVILSDVDVTELRDPSALYTDTIDVIDPPELLQISLVLKKQTTHD